MYLTTQNSLFFMNLADQIRKAPITKNNLHMEASKEAYKPVECPICGKPVIPLWEPKYNGPRATCEKCKINWAES